MRTKEQRRAKLWQPRGIQSIEIGMRVIDALRRASKPLGLKEVAAAADLPASNCHRYVVSFVRAGYVAQDPSTGRYDLGPEIVHAGLAALARLDPIGLGNDAIVRVVDQTGYTGLLAIWADPGVVIVRWVQGRLAVRTSLATGSTLPLLTSATGRVLLAHLPERRTERQAAEEQRKIAIDLAPAQLAAETRRQGYAMVSGEAIPGLTAASAPILDARGEAAAALTLIGLADGIAPNAVKALLRTARETSNALGHSFT